MGDRLPTESLLRELYALRVAGSLDGLCALFSDDARFRIAGANDGKGIALQARGLDEIRSWLAMLVKTFKLERYADLSTIVSGERAAVHWRADIHSRITGAVVPAEFVDIVEVHAGRIASYTEFFVPCG